MTKAVISGYYGYKNFGDELILSILVEHLKALNIEPLVLSGDIDYTKNEHNVDSINRYNIKAVINEIKNSDILISGGGSLLQDVTSLKSIIYYLFIIAVGIIFNKKVIIFAQGIGPINNFFAKIMTKLLLKQCYYISVRDNKSFDLLKSWGIAAELLCDPVYSVKVDKTLDTETLGIQLRNFKNVDIKFLKRFAEFINTEFPDKTVKIFSLQKTNDFEICKMFESLLNKINSNIKTEIITENIIAQISTLEYLIGMRFHALLTAILSGVKVCAINYDIKVEQLSKEYNLPLISLNEDNDYLQIANNLRSINANDYRKILKNFDWTGFDSVISV